MRKNATSLILCIFYVLSARAAERKESLTMHVAIHKAADNCQLDMLKMLCDADAMWHHAQCEPASADDINSLYNGYTPLMRVLYKHKNHLDCQKAIMLLLHHGAQLAVPDPQGRTILMYGAQGGCDASIFRELVSRATKEVLDTQDKDGNTAAHYAVRHPVLLAILKNSGAHMKIKNRKNRTPYQQACRLSLHSEGQYEEISKRSIRILLEV